MSKRHIYPLFGTDGLLGNMHTSKVTIIVDCVANEFGEGERLRLSLKQARKCIHGLQGYNSSTRNDLRKQSRPSLDLKVKKLGSLVSFFLTPYKTQAESERIPVVLEDIKATLRLLREVLSEQSHMARHCHRRPVRLELFYNEYANTFFEDQLLFPTTAVSIAEGIRQVVQEQVYMFHRAVNNQVFAPLHLTFTAIDESSSPILNSLDAEEKTYLAFAAEASAVFYGCFPVEGPIFRTLRWNKWKSHSSFQPRELLRVQAKQDTFKWTRIPYGLKTCVRPCWFETGRDLDEMYSSENREKEQRKLQQDIAAQMRHIVRIPFLYAKAKACVMGLFHEFGKFQHVSVSDTDSNDDTDAQMSTPGLFDAIHFDVLAQLNDISRGNFLERAVDSILELYSAEWRDFLDGKLFRHALENPGRGRPPSRRACALSPNITMPQTWSEVGALKSTHAASNAVVVHTSSPIITDSECKCRAAFLIVLWPCIITRNQCPSIHFCF